MPQLDLVSFPSQVFWLVIFFITFYSFVSGHFVPLLHKIVQTRSKKVSMSQDSASGQSDAQSSARSESEGLVVSALDKSATGLVTCSDEAVVGQDAEFQSGDKSNVLPLSSSVASIQARYLVSRGGLFLYKSLSGLYIKLKFFRFLLFKFIWFLSMNILLVGKQV